MDYTDINARTIDEWIANGWQWGIPISHETYRAAQNDCWELLLTPTRPVPRSWFGALKDKKILGLAAGGGQQMPILTARGALCTVLDYSAKQIASEAAIAEREGYQIELIKADMTKGLPFADQTFDLIFFPVADCYIEHVQPLWQECWRILKPGGRLLSGQDNGINFLFDDDDPARIRYRLPFNPLKDPELLALMAQTNSGVQFSHTLDEQIRGQIQAGFHLLDLYEDTEGSGFLHEHGVPTYWATLAQK